MNFTKLLNNKLNILERTNSQDASGQVFEAWLPTANINVPCRKDIAPKDYQITDENYKNIKEKYIFFIDKKFKSKVSRLNRISCEEQEFVILDVMSFDSTASIHHIELYAVKAELGSGAGFGGFAVDPNQFVKKTQKVNGKTLLGDINLEISDIPTLQAELDAKQEVSINYDDKTYQQSFVSQASIIVSHNLNKYPSVTIIETTGDEIVGNIQHVNQNQFIVTFSGATGGIVYCN